MPEGLPEPIVSLPPNPSVGQLQDALKSKKPTCAGISASYSCGNHDNVPQYSGSIVSVAAGDEIAMNSMVLSVVSIDGSGNGEGLIKVPMMNNIKLGVTLSGIKVAEGGCVVSGRAELSGVSASLLTDKQRATLEKAYAAYNQILDVAYENADGLAKGINDVKDYFEALKAKKEATRKLLAQSNLEDLSEVLNNCAEIVSQSRVAQDSLEKTICLIKTGKAKGNIAKLEKASKANIDFINKLGPALAQCQNTTFTPWAEQPCKGPCGESFVVDYSDFNCQKELSDVFGKPEKSFCKQFKGIMIYGHAEAKKQTLVDLGSVKSIKGTEYKQAILTPHYCEDGTLVGYSVGMYDKDNVFKSIVLQIGVNNVEDFKINYDIYIRAASMYYLAGEPSENMKKMSVAAIDGDFLKLWQGVTQEWKDCFSNFDCLASVIMATAGGALNMYKTVPPKVKAQINSRHNLSSNAIAKSSKAAEINTMAPKSVLSEDLKSYNSGYYSKLKNGNILINGNEYILKNNGTTLFPFKGKEFVILTEGQYRAIKSLKNIPDNLIDKITGEKILDKVLRIEKCTDADVKFAKEFIQKY